MPKRVQKLFDTCREVFSDGAAGLVPSQADVKRIVSALGEIGPANVGLTPKMPYFLNAENMDKPPVTYLHIYECEKFSIGIFCLPPSAVIPLHNHPGMTVFSKLLFGSMHIKSYDWADSTLSVDDLSGVRPPGMRLAKVNTDATFTAPCDTSILYPTSGGNMHRFTAVTSCAVLDVLGPPYSDNEGRPCTYYNDNPFENFSGLALLPRDDGVYAWLEEREHPEDFTVEGARYMGPKIVI